MDERSRRGVLFPGADERRRVHDHLTGALTAATARVAEGPPVPDGDPRRFRAALAEFDFEKPRGLEDALAWSIEAMEHGIVHVTHPRYLGLFNPAPAFPAECADRIVAAFNPQLASARTSPAAIAIERHTIGMIARRAGFPDDAAGNFTTGGSEANMTALLCALTLACKDFAADGARAFAARPVFYVSRESHLAWIKCAHMAGIGRTAVRLVATDGGGRMNAAALADAVREDRARGLIPVMIVATAGTTNAGMIDPLHEARAIADECGAWFHVDAAWGGALIVSDFLRGALAGMETADSLTIDAHKWFAATMGCGMFVTRHPRLLPSVFAVAQHFMPESAEIANDPFATTMQWSRRFLGLRLFLSLACAGWQGYAEHVEHTLACAAQLQSLLASGGWRIANRSPLAVVCAEPPTTTRSIADIVARVLASGRAWVSKADFEGRPVVRACISNGRTEPADVSEVADALQAALQ